MPVSISGDGIVLSRLVKLAGDLSPDSPALKAGLGKIALVIAARAKANIQSQRIIDQGHLLNSIAYQFYRPSSTGVGIQVGSFGVPYAAINEFGGPVTERMRRAMFASMRRRGIMQPNAAKNARRNSKGVITGNIWRARPYLTPAFEASLDMVIDTLADAVANFAADK